jgi:hypothetical protein
MKPATRDLYIYILAIADRTGPKRLYRSGTATNLPRLPFITRPCQTAINHAPLTPTVCRTIQSARITHSTHELLFQRDFLRCDLNQLPLMPMESVLWALSAHAIFIEDPALHRFPDHVVPSPRWKAPGVPTEVDTYSRLRHIHPGPARPQPLRTAVLHGLAVNSNLPNASHHMAS